MPEDLNDICEPMIPELQNWGLIRTGSEGETLRDHLEL